MRTAHASSQHTSTPHIHPDKSPDKRLRIPIYATYPHSPPPHPHYRRIISPLFSSLDQAAAFVSLFTTQADTPLQYKWLDHHTILIPQIDTTISTRTKHYPPHTITLEDIIEYSDSSPAKAGLLEHIPTTTDSSSRFASSSSPPTHHHYDFLRRQRLLLTRPFLTPLSLDTDQILDPTTNPRFASLAAVESSSASRRRPRSHQPKRTPGYIHVSTIAQSLSPPISPREARQALRSSKTPKPSGGWSWPPEQVPTITSIIKAHLKTKSK
jgi:hypothetical protein